MAGRLGHKGSKRWGPSGQERGPRRVKSPLPSSGPWTKGQACCCRGQMSESSTCLYYGELQTTPHPKGSEGDLESCGSDSEGPRGPQRRRRGCPLFQNGGSGGESLQNWVWKIALEWAGLTYLGGLFSGCRRKGHGFASVLHLFISGSLMPVVSI